MKIWQEVRWTFWLVLASALLGLAEMFSKISGVFRSAADIVVVRLQAIRNEIAK